MTAVVGVMTSQPVGDQTGTNQLAASIYYSQSDHSSCSSPCLSYLVSFNLPINLSTHQKMYLNWDWKYKHGHPKFSIANSLWLGVAKLSEDSASLCAAKCLSRRWWGGNAVHCAAGGGQKRCQLEFIIIIIIITIYQYTTTPGQGVPQAKHLGILQSLIWAYM